MKKLITEKDISWIAFWIVLIAVAFVFDLQILQFFQSIQTPILTWIFTGATFLMDYVGMVLVLAVVFIMADKKTFIPSFIALLIDLALVFILKTAVPKQRPDLQFGSFPSGHASRAFTFAQILEHKYAKYYFYIFAIIVALSRIYLNVHYPSDVAVGAFLGILTAEFTIRFKLAERIEKLLNH